MSNLYDLIKNEVYLYHERLGCLIESDNEINKSLFKESERILKILCSILLSCDTFCFSSSLVTRIFFLSE